MCRSEILVSLQGLTFDRMLSVLLPLENLLWAKLRDYTVSRVNPNPRRVFLMRVL